MKNYSFNVVIATDTSGQPVYKQFVIQATNWSEARRNLSELVAKEKT
jgi:hypothetical protein